MAAERYLGSLCKRGHEAEGHPGRSWRYVHGGTGTGACVMCMQEHHKRTKDLPEVKARHAQASRKYNASTKRRGVQRTWYRVRCTDPAFRILVRLRARLHAALVAYGRGKTRRADEYGIDYGAIIAHLGPCPGPREEWHVDHERPLCSFDLSDPEQVRAAFAPENHRWLPKEANLAKRREDVRQSRRARVS